MSATTIHAAFITRICEDNVAVAPTFAEEQSLGSGLRVCLVGKGESLVDLGFVVACITCKLVDVLMICFEATIYP